MAKMHGDLERLSRQYAQLVPYNQLSWPSGDLLKKIDVQQWLHATCFDDETVTFLPPVRYRMLVLKDLVSRIEASIDDPEEDEISESLMSSLAVLLSSALPSEFTAAQRPSYVTYNFPLPHPSGSHLPSWGAVTTLETRHVVSSAGTTGLRTWEAALHLASYFSANEQEYGKIWVAGKHVLELGAGTGLLSILCATHLGARAVTATDGDERVLETLGNNVFLNMPNFDKIKSFPFRWGWTLVGTSLEERVTGENPVDLVIGADITYDSAIISSLVSGFRELSRLRPAVEFIVAATVRNEETLQKFESRCEESGYQLTDIEYRPEHESHQQGPFYSTATPFRIIHIKKAPTTASG